MLLVTHLYGGFLKLFYRPRQYKDNFNHYKMGYLSKPSPIILTDLTGGLYINNENKKTECKLHSAIHRTILENAVRMAISSKSITAK